MHLQLANFEMGKYLDPSVTRNTRFMVELFGALEFLLLLHQTQASQHLTDGYVRIIGPKHPAGLRPHNNGSPLYRRTLS